MIKQPLSVEVNGRIWRLFDVQFQSDDGICCSVYLYALNREHASYRLEDLKRTGKLADGDIEEVAGG